MIFPVLKRSKFQSWSSKSGRLTASPILFLLLYIITSVNSGCMIEVEICF